jgi:hypothetical protein
VVVVFFIWQRITAVVVPVDHLYSEIHRVAATDLPPWSNYCKKKKIQEKYVYRESVKQYTIATSTYIGRVVFYSK